MIPPRARRAHTRAEVSSVQVNSRVDLYLTARDAPVDNPNLEFENCSASRGGSPGHVGEAIEAALRPGGRHARTEETT